MRRSTTTSTTRKQSPSATSTYTAHVSAGATTVASSASSGTKRSLENPITVDGDGSQTRDFVHVDDVVEANLLAATTEHTGEAYNIGRGEQTSIAELAETICAVADTDSEVTYTDPRPGDIDESVADISKARSELGFEPTVSLREGLKTIL